ncbi:MAG TPA: cysteine--tRNA ligase [Nitrososphaerales archaeon]|nr:cysteine--tRNA ligase [Nitrososphaerales archaeon]
MLKLFNSLGRELQTFTPIKDGEVRMYTCGPTVWNYAHIGNFRAFVFEDLLRRYLIFKGFKVTQVKNITDVEDRIIKGIKQFKKSRIELTSFFENEFMEDLATLGIERAEKYPRATDNIDDMVDLVKKLVAKKYAYKSEDGSFYFDVSKFKNYGALSGVKLGTGKGAGRVSQDHYEEKKEATDFALWKAWDPEDGDVFWETELGKGRPGWHIECSTMSMKYLGESFDLHTGGMDLKFPHHENEIAQSEAATGKKFVNYWLHSEMLNIKGAEMHKSIGNVIYLRDLIKEGWEPLTIRLFLLSSRYRDPIDLTDTSLDQARSQRARLQEFVSRLKSVSEPGGVDESLVADALSEFEAAMDDDLNSPKALSVIFTFVKKGNAHMDAKSLGKDGAAEVIELLRKFNSVFGILDFSEEKLQEELVELLAKREEARKKKDYAESDRLRRKLLEAGIVVEDTPSGMRWKRATSG